MDIKAYLAKKRIIVDRALESIVPQAKTYPPRVFEAMRYSLLAGGKRVRPILAIAAAEALGAKTPGLMPIAGTLELIHTYSLIHDDLPAMDNDKGLPQEWVSGLKRGALILKLLEQLGG